MYLTTVNGRYAGPIGTAIIFTLQLMYIRFFLVNAMLLNFYIVPTAVPPTFSTKFVFESPKGGKKN